MPIDATRPYISFKLLDLFETSTDFRSPNIGVQQDAGHRATVKMSGRRPRRVRAASTPALAIVMTINITFIQKYVAYYVS
jgi:hypothetical protein